MRVYNKAIDGIMEKSIINMKDCFNVDMCFICKKIINKWHLSSSMCGKYLPACDSLEELKIQLMEDWLCELIMEISVDNRHCEDGQS